jgi:hypothetical protein
MRKKGKEKTGGRGDGEKYVPQASFETLYIRKFVSQVYAVYDGE